MFKAISVRYPFHFARALTPSLRDYCHSNSSVGCFKQKAHYLNPICSDSRWYLDDDFFKVAGSFYQILDKHGVARKALTSRRSCFCKNIGNLEITDYPLSHCAEFFGFTFSVAICVENTLLVDTPCILEFFLLPGDYSDEYIGGLLDSLLRSVKQHLPPYFKILSEDAPGEPLFLEIGNFLENGMHVVDGTKATASVIRGYNISEIDVANGVDATPLVPRENNFGIHVGDAQENISGMHVVVNGTEAAAQVIEGNSISEIHASDGVETSPLVPQGENLSTILSADKTGPIVEGENNCSTKASTSRMEVNKFHISLDELKLHFGKTLDEAAKDLGVSRSTLKRIRKEHGIHRWPSHKKNRANQSLFMNKTLNDAPHTGENITLVSSGSDSAHSVLPVQTSIHPSHYLQTDQHQTAPYGDNEVSKIVTIKASYGHGAFIKFKLNTRSTLQDLQEEVTKRLKWEANKFVIKYEDEDRDWITIVIDEDLQNCLQTSIDRGETTVSMSINLKLD